MNRPVWLFSMDSEQFFAPPTTTAALTAYFQKYGASAASTDIELVHFHDSAAITSWLTEWQVQQRPRAERALQLGLQPAIGFSFYTWNAAEFLELAAALKADLPGLLSFAGGPHVQQAEDYLGVDPLDAIVLGEGEVTFQQLLDASGPEEWPQIA
ncbi:MAG: cobalamin-dependent protein, partial [Gammaproteobacteria bacterium]|nr:cobalamin-dependent protein [Gammaproteobacteria bacterium]